MTNDRVGNNGIARTYAAVVGFVLVVSGLLGFISNPFVGSEPGALLAANSVHNIVHIATGALALYIAFGLSGESQANGVIAFGVLYLVIFVVLLLSPTLFGLFGDIPANAADHVLHAALALSALAVGYLARGGAQRTVAT